jgi:Flp pilus assembly protein TadG
MNASKMRSQRGQAMTEFIVAMAVLLPLFFGIVYIGKFSDIKHQAVQASRFAAFERALDPSARQESDAVLVEETRARFFTDASRNQGKIGFQDNTQGLATSGTLNPLWGELNGTPLIRSYQDPNTGIRVDVTSNSMDLGAFAPIDKGAQALFKNLNSGGQIQADVEVPIANVAALPAPLNNLNMKVAARTVVAGDAWNGGGTQNVADHFTPVSVPGKTISFLNSIPGIDALFQLLADTPAPQFGCVKPDVVPAATAPGANYQASDACY